MFYWRPQVPKMHLTPRETNDRSLESLPPWPLPGLPKSFLPSNAQHIVCSPGIPSLIHSSCIKWSYSCSCSMWLGCTSIISFYFILFYITVSSIWVFSIPHISRMGCISCRCELHRSIWHVLNKYWVVKRLSHSLALHWSVPTLCTAFCWALTGNMR